MQEKLIWTISSYLDSLDIQTELIKVGGYNKNNLRYADETAENKEDLQWLLEEKKGL